MLLDNRPIFLMNLGRQLVMGIHQVTYLGAVKTELRPRYYVPNLENLIKTPLFRCAACGSDKPESGKEYPTRDLDSRKWVYKNCALDFTEIRPTILHYKYLLVFVDSFSGWMKAFPIRGSTVSKKLLYKKIPKFGLPQLSWPKCLKI